MPRARAMSLTEVASYPRSRKIWAAVRQISARLDWRGGTNARTVAINAALIPCDRFLSQADVCFRPTDRSVGGQVPGSPGLTSRERIRKFGKRTSRLAA